MQGRNDHATPRRIEQRKGRTLAAADIIVGLELNEAHATQCAGGGRFKGGEACARCLGCSPLLGNPLENLGKSLLGGQRIGPRNQRRIVGAQPTEVTDGEQGDEECKQGKEYPSNADGKENLAIHGCILSASTAPLTWVRYPLRTIL
jgi:hypothetical protein